MKKILILVYETEKQDGGFNTLIIADPDKTLPNGNKEIVKMLLDNYADEVYAELVRGTYLEEKYE